MKKTLLVSEMIVYEPFVLLSKSNQRKFYWKTRHVRHRNGTRTEFWLNTVCIYFYSYFEIDEYKFCQCVTKR